MVKFIPYQSSKIAFRKFGTGEKLLFAFHGFADSSQIFAQVPVLFERFTVYAIDSPFHGETIWKEKEHTVNDLIFVIQFLLEKENKKDFNLIGYSMGGRICLKIIEQIGEQIEQLFLIAPDGIYLPFGHRMMLALPNSIKYWIVNRMKYTNFYIRFAQILYRLRMIGEGQLKFILWNLGNPKRHQRLINTWLSLINFQYHLPTIKKIINHQKISTFLYLGKQDVIISPLVGKKIKKNLDSITIQILDEGHRIVGKTLNQAIREDLKNV